MQFYTTNQARYEFIEVKNFLFSFLKTQWSITKCIYEYKTTLKLSYAITFNV